MLPKTYVISTPGNRWDEPLPMEDDRVRFENVEICFTGTIELEARKVRIHAVTLPTHGRQRIL